MIAMAIKKRANETFVATLNCRVKRKSSGFDNFKFFKESQLDFTCDGFSCDGLQFVPSEKPQLKKKGGNGRMKMKKEKERRMRNRRERKEEKLVRLKVVRSHEGSPRWRSLIINRTSPMY